MKNFIKNKITVFSALIGFIGGVIWIFSKGIESEQVILTLISALEILGYFLLPKEPSYNGSNSKFNNEQKIKVNVNINNGQSLSKEQNEITEKEIDRTTILDIMCKKTSILFIDDDNKFNVVKILKDSGWKKTKSTVDIKTLDVQAVKDADIVFVDINGVGKLLNLEFEGLDLALMLKQKYKEKKIIIYSANRNSNSFHNAWDLCDFKLEKNALPYQFQNLVEEYSIEKFKREK